MGKKGAKIYKHSQKKSSHVDLIHIQPNENTVEWSFSGADYDGEFVIWFPDIWTPLAPGSVRSNGGMLTRTISTSIPRGKRTHYPYAVFLENAHEMVDSDSPPDMIIE